MKQFDITVVRQSMLLILIIVFPLSLIGCLFIFVELESGIAETIAAVLLFFSINGFIVYTAYEKLSVVAKKDELCFTWAKKFFFREDKVEFVHVKNIKTLVIDKGDDGFSEFLKKIETDEKVIPIGNNKIWSGDAKEFISFLKVNTNARIVDSWYGWSGKWIFKSLYVLMTIILISGAALLIWIAVYKGLNNVKPSNWLMFVGSYSSLLFYWQSMKRKLKENRW